MRRDSTRTADEPSRPEYGLDVGEQAVGREAGVDDIYRAATLHALAALALRPGMSVCDVGCGTGSMLPFLAQQVGPEGRVTGLDQSAEQVAAARNRVGLAGLTTVDVVRGNATDTPFGSGGHDLVFSRFVINHLLDPDALVREMARLAKPGGVVMVVEIDFTSTRTLPRSAPYERIRDLWTEAGRIEGRQFDLGARLPEVFRRARLTGVSFRFEQPVTVVGAAKDMVERAVRTGRGTLERLGLATARELDDLLAEVAAHTSGTECAIVQPAVFACWARLPTG